jgi:hypothetical protein
MNARSCYRHPMNRLALGFFIAALVCFVVFHFVPFEPDGRGPTFWEIWCDLAEMTVKGHLSDLDGPTLSGIAALVTSSFLVAVSSFLVFWLTRSSLLRWLLVSMSAMVLIGLIALIFVTKTTGRGRIWLVVMQALHLLGCLCIRRPQPEEFVPAPHLDS